MRQPTVFHALKRMRERDGHHIDARMLNGRKTARKITPKIAELLLSQRTLQNWSGLFISQRVMLLRNLHGVRIAVSTLKDFYKRHKVKYLRVSYQYYQAQAVPPQLRYNFAARLAELRDKNRILIYIDEASFHLWLKKTHTWTKAERPVRIVLGQDRCKGRTVFGAISTSLNGGVFSIEESTTKEATGRFLRKIRHALQTDEKAYIVLDRHASHKSHDTAELAAELNFELLLMPPHTPELNSIEALWSVIKRDFKQRAESMKMVRMQQEEFEELLQSCLDDVTPRQQSEAALRNNRHYLHQCIEDLI